MLELLGEAVVGVVVLVGVVLVGIGIFEGVVLVEGTTVFDGIFELGTVILGWVRSLSVSAPSISTPSASIPSEFMSSSSDPASIPGVIIPGLLVSPVIPGISSVVTGGGTTCPVPFSEPGLIWFPSTPVCVWPLV